MLNEGAELLAKLSSQAIASGNLDAAERLADEALRRDPQDDDGTGRQEAGRQDFARRLGGEVRQAG